MLFMVPMALIMQNKLKTIAIYCGSKMGNDLNYSVMANQMAKAIADTGLTLIYGGAKVGLMGILADTVLKFGGKVIGVIPQSLVDCEITHEGLTDLHIVNSMHERKAMIAEIADSFIMLPGGPGTWEEFFEIITWGKLGYHKKPCGILNINNYYDLLLQLLDHAVDKKFLYSCHRDMILVDDLPQRLLQKIFNYNECATLQAEII